MTIADTTLTDMIHSGLIGPTGHTSCTSSDEVLAADLSGERLAIVELTKGGFPDFNEPWTALRFPDGSAMMVTHVRGREREGTDFWKAVPDLGRFDIVRAG